jgi:hypothetical protein
VRRTIELATRGYELRAAVRRALAQSRREEREGKVRRFTHCEGRRRASQAVVEEIVFTRRFECDFRRLKRRLTPPPLRKAPSSGRRA